MENVSELTDYLIKRLKAKVATGKRTTPMKRERNHLFNQAIKESPYE